MSDWCCFYGFEESLYSESFSWFLNYVQATKSLWLSQEKNVKNKEKQTSWKAFSSIPQML